MFGHCVTAKSSWSRVLMSLRSEQSRPVWRKATCAFQHTRTLGHVRFYCICGARLHTRADLCAGACGSSAGARAAYKADGQRLISRPSLKHQPLEFVAALEGLLRCPAHTHTPNQGRARRGPRLLRPRPTGD